MQPPSSSPSQFGGYPPGAPPPPPPDTARPPDRIVPVAGSAYGLAVYGRPPRLSGPAVGSLVAGVASVLVSIVVGCLGLADLAVTMEGEAGGFGLLAGGAFAVLATFLGGVGVVLGTVGLRQTRRGRATLGEAVSGRGLAVAGLSCGGAGLLFTACGLGAALVVAVG